MAREEHAREDLLAEATALVRRIELRIDSIAEPVVIGFRAGGAASIYWGESPAYHFNTVGQLRRAFVDGILFKAEHAQLVALARQRSPHETILASHALSPAEQASFMATCEEHLTRLRDALTAEQFARLRQVPPQQNVLADVEHWLRELPRPISIASSPRVG